MDELSLIQSARKGDLDSFNRLILAYQDLAFNVAYRMLADEDLAEDAVQNAFISAYNNLSAFRGGSFKAWVMRMVTNGCYDELRRQKRRPTAPLEPVNEDEEEHDSAPWLASDDPSAETTLEQAGAGRDLGSYQLMLTQAFNRGGKPVRLLGVGVRLEDLRGGFEQMELFER